MEDFLVKEYTSSLSFKYHGQECWISELIKLLVSILNGNLKDEEAMSCWATIPISSRPLEYDLAFTDFLIG